MNIAIIIGSTRSGRATPLVGKWVEQTAQKSISDKATISVIDLADYDLPLFDEPISPKYNPDRQSEGDVKKFLDDLLAADGYVFITPEYNHSVSGVLKNAIDYIAFETNKKAALIVAHGGMGGVRATEHLRNILSELGLVTTPVAVNLSGMVAMGGIIENDGSLTNKESGAQGMLEGVLSDLVWYSAALSSARE